MKLPNSYGSVFKLSGNRRNPWTIRKTSWETVDGKAKRKYTYLGYYKTRAEALDALSEYNRSPYDTSQTFANVYDTWSAFKFPTISASNINSYQVSYKKCPELHDKIIGEIKTSELQLIIDSIETYPSKKKMKILFNQVFDYAVANDIIPKNNSHLLNIGQAVKSTKHYMFSEEEMSVLWQHSDNEYVQIILMLIYTGCRPSELFNLKTDDVNIDEEFFSIIQGKNSNAVRIVPIHKKILPFFISWKNKEQEYLITSFLGKKINFKNFNAFSEVYWEPILKELNILEYKLNGETRTHLPYDCRHTFTSMWAKKQLNESIRRKIQGHSGKGIGDQVYTHYDIETLSAEINKL